MLPCNRHHLHRRGLLQNQFRFLFAERVSRSSGSGLVSECFCNSDECLFVGKRNRSGEEKLFFSHMYVLIYMLEAAVCLVLFYIQVVAYALGMPPESDVASRVNKHQFYKMLICVPLYVIGAGCTPFMVFGSFEDLSE